MSTQRRKKQPTLAFAIFDLAAVMAIVIIGLLVFEAPIQILMLFAMLLQIPMMLYLGYSYKEIESGIVDSMAKALPSILILLTVGMLIGTFMASGTVPILIYYGIQFISPRFFLVSSLLFLSVISSVREDHWNVPERS